ncbi:nucleolar protein 53 [Kwoniella mangroviensis CBS 10435]|uniref:Ribosome biogenesis protein NOP53 n=1 Tax=Kwoniella mangroviensis CBS 10435 TaxID=1331196 RepID=A0A1B9IXA0_9TREE|nr:nucleolar protein 53 [Kwoniella mangroviensis CBS 10435]
MAPTKTSKASTKPYERPASSSSSSAKGKGKAKATPSNEVNIGAPSTLGQSSRKGKKAWRKNIDITVEEGALERGREEERVTGGPVAQKSNNDLFTVDVVGDIEVGKKARRAHKPLRSLSILNERSAVPSLTSKPSTSNNKTKSKSHISSAEKERLRRIARRSAVHPDDRISSADIRKIDPSELTKDVWTETQEEEIVVKGGFGEETIIKKTVKVPTTLAKAREIYLNSQVENGVHLEIPQGGLSYNPTLESHQSLINDAVQEEIDLLKREEEQLKKVEELGGVVENRRNNWVPSEFAEGMAVGPGELSDEDDQSDDEEGGEVVVKKQSKRKTTAQRNKALRAKMAQQAVKAELEKRKLHKSVSSVAAYKRELEKKMKEQKEKEIIAKLAKEQKAKMGLQEGEKIGKYRLNKKRVEVQLGEDLAESLRQVKPEGNLFKDRFLALQKRALIEPRVPVLPKKRVTKIKEYEKHAYKRFE